MDFFQRGHFLILLRFLYVEMQHADFFLQFRRFCVGCFSEKVLKVHTILM